MRQQRLSSDDETLQVAMARASAERKAADLEAAQRLEDARATMQQWRTAEALQEAQRVVEAMVSQHATRAQIPTLQQRKSSRFWI